MNLIVIMLDSLRQDHVSLYHQGQGPFADVAPCQTPNIDAFGQESLIFENIYPEAFPTIPVRTALLTGQRTLPYRPWQPLTAEDVTATELLRGEGYVCGLISDTYHYRAPGMNFHRNFHSYRWIRGQEYDPYESGPVQRNLDDYVNAHYPPLWRERVHQFLANTDAFTEEQRWFPAQVVDEARTWLRRNRAHDRLFLWIDSFDPHEPWDPPPHWDAYTDPAYRGPRLILPMGGPAADWASPEQIRHIRGLYAGEVAFVDHCLGQLFATLRDLGYYDDSIILLVADHGHPLADHGKFLKGTDRLYNELLKVPFLLRLPGGRGGGQRISALAQFHDVLPTLLTMMGWSNLTSDMHGRSFDRVVRGETAEHRDRMITGYYAGHERCIRDDHWSLVLRPADEPDELYDLTADRGERRNLIDAHPEIATALARSFGSLYYRSGAPVATVKGVQGAYEVASGSVE